MQVTTTTKTSTGIQAALIVGALTLTAGLGAVAAAVFSLKTTQKTAVCLPCVEKTNIASLLKSKSINLLAGQNILEQWSKTYGAEQEELFTSVAQRGDQFIAGGYFISPDDGMRKPLVMTIDSSGELVDYKAFGDDYNQYNPESILVSAEDGSVLVVGYRNLSTIFAASFDIGDTYNLNWEKEYDDTTRAMAKDVVETEETSANPRSFMLVGSDSQGTRGTDGLLLAVEPSTGESRWNKLYGTEYTDSFESIVTTNDGGLLLGGWTWGDTAKKGQAWLVKTDGTGTEQWSKMYGTDESSEEIHDIVKTDDGYLLVGWVQVNPSGEYDENILIIKVDTLGNEQWSKQYDVNVEDRAYSGVQTNDDGFLVFGGVVTEENFSNRDAYLLKIDDEGNKEWDQFFGGNTYDREDYGYDIISSSDGSFVLAGSTESYGRPFLDSTSEDVRYADGWLIKFKLNPLANVLK